MAGLDEKDKKYLKNNKLLKQLQYSVGDDFEEPDKEDKRLEEIKESF